MNDEKFEFLDDLNEKQREACISKENILLKACPGSGKTRTLTYKLAYTSMQNNSSRKLNVAITYTNRAADEIKKRIDALDIDLTTIWAGTIHQFCLEYIIRPYSMYDEDLRRGYRIIDEYVQAKYLKEIVEELGMKKIVGFDNPLDYPDIQTQYYLKLKEQREIDFDLILKKSYELLEKNRFISKGMASLIRCIFVDEYQDTNELQYQIVRLIFLENMSIQLMFVGDTDQAIYGGIGGKAKSIDTLIEEFQTKFSKMILDGCYRSSQKIIDYYSQFQVDKKDIESKSVITDEQSSISYIQDIHSSELVDRIACIVKSEIERGVLESEICILAPQWWLLFPFSKAIKELLPDVKFDAPDITPFKRDPLNLFYIMAKLVFTKSGENSWLRKRYAFDIMKILDEEYGYSIDSKMKSIDIIDLLISKKGNVGNGLDVLKKCINNLMIGLNINIYNDLKLLKAYEDYFEKAEKRIEKYNLEIDIDYFERCFMEKKGVVINSYHGVKGEEYTTVIAFGFLQGYIPNWKLVYERTVSNQYKIDEVKKLTYVVASRAKEKIIFFSERGRVTRKGDELVANNQLVSYQYAYDNLE